MRKVLFGLLLILTLLPILGATAPVCAGGQIYPNGCGACVQSWSGYQPYGDFGWVNQNGCGGGYCYSAFVAFNDGWSMFYQYGCRNYYDPSGAWTGHSYCSYPLTVEGHP